MEQINILVVDDDKEIAELVEIHLVGDGFRVFKAYDGHEAMRVMEKEKIMLAVLVSLFIVRSRTVTSVSAHRSDPGFRLV